MSDLQALINKAQAIADAETYCWFRLTYAKIGQVKPRWIAWFERLGGTWEQNTADTAELAVSGLLLRVGRHV